MSYNIKIYQLYLILSMKKIDKLNNNNNSTEVSTSKRMGRPRKNATDPKQTRDSKTKPKSIVKKKRGHRTKKILDDSDISSSSDSDNQVTSNSSVIVGLQIPAKMSTQLSKLPQKKSSKPKKKQESSSESDEDY